MRQFQAFQSLQKVRPDYSVSRICVRHFRRLIKFIKFRHKGLSINVDFVFHYLTIRAKRVDCVSICRWGVRQTGRILTEFRVQLQTLLPSVLVSRQRPQHFTSPRRKSTFWAQTAYPLPNQTVELQSFSTASIIRDNFSFRGSSYTNAKATRSGSS